MSTKLQTMTLGLALAAAGLAGAAFVQPADANRVTQPTGQGIAYVDVFGLIDEVIKGEAYETARDDFDTAQQAELSQMQTQMQAVQSQIQLADPNAPETQGLYAQAQQMQQRMQQFYQNYQNSMQQLIGTQIAEAYALIYDAAGAESAEQGIHFLFATRPGSDLLVDSLTGVAQEILARPLVAPSEALDITADIRERMGLPDPAEADADAEAQPDAPAEDAGEPDAADPMGEEG